MPPHPLRFADATDDYASAKVVILGVPYDRTTSYRPGTRFGPNAIREGSWNFESYLFDHGVDLRDIDVFDMGDMEEFGPVDEMYTEVHSVARTIVGDGKFPVTFGGEHSISPPVVAAFPKDIGVVVVDAHLDFRDEYLGWKHSHACASRRFADHVGVESVMQLGIRSVALEDLENSKGLEFIDAYFVAEQGIDAAIKRIETRMGKRKIYLSIDIDGIDPAYAPGTGTPEPFGLTPLHVKRLISKLSSKLVGADIVEVSPPYDNGNTATLAARLAREIIATRHPSYR